MKYYVLVTEETDFMQTWTDVNAPNFGWGFDQVEFAECIENLGEYYASYDSMEITEERVVTYVDDTGEHSYTLKVGEYGKRDDSIPQP